MAVIVINGMATSYDLPQYVGELFRVRRRPNTVLRLIGGLTGGLRTVNNTVFALGVDYEVPSGSQPAILEGADPLPSEIGTGQTTQVVQIFQYAVEMTYTAEATSSIAGLAVIPGSTTAGGGLVNPRSLAWQIDRKMEQMQNDANYTFLRGVYQLPGTNATARKTRGIRTAIVTHVFGNAGTPRALTTTIFEAALLTMSQGPMPFGTNDELYVMGDALQISRLSKLYANQTTAPQDRNAAGIVPLRIYTLFGIVNLVIEPDMAAGELMIWQPQYCRVVALPIPNKGIIFSEPLAKTGSAEKYQVYGELSIDYKNESLHGVITDLLTT